MSSTKVNRMRSVILAVGKSLFTCGASSIHFASVDSEHQSHGRIGGLYCRQLGPLIRDLRLRESITLSSTFRLCEART